MNTLYLQMYVQKLHLTGTIIHTQRDTYTI